MLGNFVKSINATSYILLITRKYNFEQFLKVIEYFLIGTHILNLTCNQIFILNQFNVYDWSAI